MAFIEVEPSTHQAPATTKVASLAPHGGSRTPTPAARGLFARARAAFEGSVWAPVLAKALGVLGGMLALALVGASSIAREKGVPATASAHPSPRLAAGAAPFATPPDAGPPDAATDAAGPAPPSVAPANSAGLTADGKVILNQASVDDLRRVPGVGPKRAQAIIALREKLGGRFKRLTDLLRVKGIGTRSLKKMEAYMVLDASPAVAPASGTRPTLRTPSEAGAKADAGSAAAQ